MNYLRGTDNINENNSYSYLHIYILIICCYVAYLIKGTKYSFVFYSTHNKSSI